MEISKLTFSEEMKQRMSKPLTNMEKSKLRWEKLKEAEANGRLSLAKNKYDVARLVGFTDENIVNGSTWLARLLRNGNLTEILLGYDNTGHLEYEYHTGKEPGFDAKKNAKNRRKKRVRTTEVKNVSTPQEEESKKVSVVVGGPSDSIKIEIVNEKANLNVYTHDVDQAIQIISALLKGE